MVQTDCTVVHEVSNWEGRNGDLGLLDTTRITSQVTTNANHFAWAHVGKVALVITHCDVSKANQEHLVTSGTITRYHKCLSLSQCTQLDICQTIKHI